MAMFRLHPNLDSLSFFFNVLTDDSYLDYYYLYGIIEVFCDSPYGSFCGSIPVMCSV